MSSGREARRVGDDHIRQAVKAGKPDKVIGSFAEDASVLAMPQLPTRTRAEVIKAERARRKEVRGAADEIAWLVKEIHGCAHVHKGDPPCLKPEHQGDVKAAALLRKMLGLDGAPMKVRKASHQRKEPP